MNPARCTDAVASREIIRFSNAITRTCNATNSALVISGTGGCSPPRVEAMGFRPARYFLPCCRWIKSLVGIGGWARQAVSPFE